MAKSTFERMIDFKKYDLVDWVLVAIMAYMALKFFGLV